ncbi:DUF1045 domain-containing protein [Pararhodobacter zhoushanensis]|uniref:DUF1045 domain-containing protein n=1 Tax=Pararhodobacter zhoushanensis TaxID=2479545 RepID=UPI000F8ECD5B|nr:DUF1045 domain-containing protein [Pararhodobacter zhoushanensis]
MKRYALYYAPDTGPFADAAAQWLGRDAATGRAVAQPDAMLPALTLSARRYGFHGTLKAPFRLAEGVSEDDLIAAVEIFAAGRSSVVVDGLRVASLDGFLALIPEGDTTALDDFAAKVVTRFERLRAPLTEAEVARRKPERLSARQRALLETYGYPYVLDQFRFHMTLTDRLDAGQTAVLQPMAKALFEPLLPRPFAFKALSVFGEAEDGSFHQLLRARLG